MSQHVVDHPDVLESSNETIMKTVSLKDSEAEQEMIDGQPVIVAVRWILIISSLILALWNVGSLDDLRLQIVAILLLAITNFYLQAQLLMKKPVNKNIIYGASVVDLLLITMLVIFQGGYFSSLYVFYLPAIAAFAVAFPTLHTMLLTSAAILLYGLVSLLTNDSEGSVILTRLIMIAGVAYCGNLYLRIERYRRAESQKNQEDLLNNLTANRFGAQMADQQESKKRNKHNLFDPSGNKIIRDKFTKTTIKGVIAMRIEKSTAQEAAEDIFFGQLVLIYARWFVIVAMVVLALWSSSTVNQMTLAVLFIVPMMAINFFVHGRYLMEKPVNAILLLLLSLVDVIIITLVVLFWKDGRGLASQFYIFYYPILLAFAFVFPGRHSSIFIIFTLGVYTTACLLATPSILLSSENLERLMIRLITMASMGVLGVYYWRIQRNRRRQEMLPEPGPA